MGLFTSKKKSKRLDEEIIDLAKEDIKQNTLEDKVINANENKEDNKILENIEEVKKEDVSNSDKAEKVVEKKTRFSFLNRRNNKDQRIEREKKQIIKSDLMSLEDATDYVQIEFIESNQDDLNSLQIKQSFAMAGDRPSRQIITDEFKRIIEDEEIYVEGYTVDELAKEIFANKYGLGILDKYFLDPTIDEIRVNRVDNIRIVRRGVAYDIKERFKSEEEIERTIKRMIMEDIGISLDKSNPKIESILKDGTRLTAVCYPISASWNFILRKHDSFEPTVENYIDYETFDRHVWDVLSVLTRGNAKILFSGNVGSGKTTLLVKVVGELSDRLRIGVIGKDSEVKLAEVYPDRDVVEFEEQPQIGVNMKELFNTMLRESVDALVIEEFRGSGEAIEAVRACSRGLPNAFSTAHFNNASEAIEGVGLLLIEEGLNLTLDLAKLRAARAFNIIVQLFGDSITGKKKLIAISEVVTTLDGQIIVQDLIKWTPKGDNYFGEGEWKEINQPSNGMIKSILVNVPREEVEALGWNTSLVL